MTDALRSTLKTALERLKPAAEAFHDSVVGTVVEASPLFHVVETALAEMRGAPRGATALILATALEHLLIDAAEAGFGDTPVHAACDMAVEEAQAAFAIVRRALAGKGCD